MVISKINQINSENENKKPKHNFPIMCIKIAFLFTEKKLTKVVYFH